jgi:phospholipid/cholesterol/gamma-HCH transport system ATP-binding protein
VIQLEDVRKVLGERPVLKGVSLTIERGQLAAIVGQSGAGKSVLLKHITRLVRPDSGRVVIDGTDLERLGPHALAEVRARFGVLFQGGALFDSMTILENLLFVLERRTRLPERERRERALARLAAVGLAADVAKYPAELSGGMRKRAALARALVHDPDIVLFDEPTTGLDPVLLSAIHRLIVESHRERRFTGIIVSHEIPEVLLQVEAVAVLQDGVIVEQGTPEQVLASRHPGVRAFLTGGPDAAVDTVKARRLAAYAALKQQEVPS